MLNQKTFLLIILLASSFLLTSTAFANKPQDPMRPPNFSPASSASAGVQKQWQITEILISEERRIAVINDTLVKPGDTINNAKVIHINTDHVVLSNNNKTFKQYLLRIPVKQQTLPGTD